MLQVDINEKASRVSRSLPYGELRRRRCRRGRLAGPSGQSHRRLHARWADRSGGAADFAAAHRPDRQEFLCRERARRRRQCRRDEGGAVAARRLYDPGDRRQHHQQSVPVRAFRLRSAERFRRGHGRRRDAGGAGGPSLRAGQDRERAGRLDPRQSGQGELRLAGHRHAAAIGRRAVCAFTQSRPCPCALQWRRAGGRSDCRRPHADLFRRVGAGGAADQMAICAHSP